MAKRKQVTLDGVYFVEVEKLRAAYRKNKLSPPSLPYLVNRAIGHGIEALKLEVLKGFAIK